jgi:hypothetical protein
VYIDTVTDLAGCEFSTEHKLEMANYPQLNVYNAATITCTALATAKEILVAALAAATKNN